MCLLSIRAVIPGQFIASVMLPFSISLAHLATLALPHNQKEG
jgi:hypothetical protein